MGSNTATTTSAAEEFLLKETRPNIGARFPSRGYQGMCSYHLVEQMEYIFVHVIEALNLPAKDTVAGSFSFHVDVKLGACEASTRHVEEENPKWDQVFAFSKDQVQAQNAMAEVIIRNKKTKTAAAAAAATSLVALGDDDSFVGKLTFDLSQIPLCIRPNKVAPQWYKLVGPEDGAADAEEVQLLLAVWLGTQSDEFFPRAWHSDATSTATVYKIPRLWYVRVNVIEAQDLVVSDTNGLPERRVVAVLGNQTYRTRHSKSVNPFWNEDLICVAAEPLQHKLVLTVEELQASGKYQIVGRCFIPLQDVHRRLTDMMALTRWYSLSRVSVIDEYGGQPKNHGKIHARICLEGGYHVLSEQTSDCSDLRPSGKQLWRPNIGVLEVGIICAHGLILKKIIDGRSRRPDAYCVAKYGMKWVRTRTVMDNSNPKWNEQYCWEVYDPFTVFAIAVFDDHHVCGYRGAKHSRMGKVRIRISTLESNRVYKYSHPLLTLNSSGVEKMGEIELVVRFTCSSWINTMLIYSRPRLPKMHYMRPLSELQTRILRDIAIEIISRQFNEFEPPLRKEVVDYLLDVDFDTWSLRRSKVNFLRVMNLLSWVDQVCKWERPLSTILIHIFLVTFLLHPKLIPSAIFLSLFFIGIWNYQWRRPWDPPQIDSHRLFLGDLDVPDDPDEEFDTFPTSQTSDIVKMRYDRLRSVATRIQREMGEWAVTGERFQCLLNWRDPRATSFFLLFCICASGILYFVGFRVVAVMLGFYWLRHPWFHIFKIHLLPVNFFRRLPSKEDCML